MTAIEETAAATEAGYDALRAEIEALRLELATLREELAGEVRTRRLVVVDDVGVERIFTSLSDDMMKLTIAWSDGERDAEANMYAGNLASVECAAAAFEVWAGGECALSLSGDEQGSAGKAERRSCLILQGDDGLKERRMRVTPHGITAGTVFDESARAVFSYNP